MVIIFKLHGTCITFIAVNKDWINFCQHKYSKCPLLILDLSIRDRIGHFEYLW